MQPPAPYTIPAVGSLLNLVIGAELPHPAGFVLALGISAIGFVIVVGIRILTSDEEDDWSVALGGLLLAAALGLLGLVMIVVFGWPAFK